MHERPVSGSSSDTADACVARRRLLQIRVASLVAVVLVVGACAVKLPVPVPVAGAPGDLDTTFGRGGKVTTDFGGLDEVYGLVVQPDGKIVAAGVSLLDLRTSDIVLARYNPDGSLDARFGRGGKVVTAFTGGANNAHALVLQPDRKIVVAGFICPFLMPTVCSGLNFALVRYNPDGSLDPTFGTGGKATTNFAESANGLARQPDGRIVAVGSTSTVNFALARYTPSGSLDPTFGLGGTVLTGIVNGFQASAVAVTLQPDGKIVVAGQAQGFALARYTPNGVLDPTFGSGGKVTTPTDRHGAAALAVVRQRDGKIVASGFIGAGFAVVRYNPDGSFDPTFGTGGTVITDFGGTQGAARSLVLQPDGRIVAAGSAGGNFALARYNLDGSLDPTFGTGGKVVTSASPDGANAVVLQPDGRIVVAGSAAGNFALARYLGGPNVHRHPEPPGDR
jgi:uncharacterized delta-60 repeat protein